MLLPSITLLGFPLRISYSGARPIVCCVRSGFKLYSYYTVSAGDKFSFNAFTPLLLQLD